MKLPCTLMRGGTSKAVILRADTLPRDAGERDRIILRVFGSPDRRQIDGLGGADPLTSKVAVIGPPSRPDAHIDYTFADVLIDEPRVDTSGYCGNVTAAVAAYAIDKGYVAPAAPMTKVHVHNTNTGRIINAEVRVEDGRVVEQGTTAIAGVPGTGSPIHLDFADTAGSISGALLPAGTTVMLGAKRQHRASIVDAGNPMVFLAAGDFGVLPGTTVEELNGRSALLAELKTIRVEAAGYLGLLRDGAALSESIPAVGLVGRPAAYTDYAGASTVPADAMDFWAREIFLGSVHKAYGVSETVCTAVAALIPGTVVAEATRPGAAARGVVRIGHPSGVIEARACVPMIDGKPVPKVISVVRTARLLMDGEVYLPDAGP